MTEEEKQFETVRQALLSWLEQYGYCVYGTFTEFNTLLDEFKHNISIVQLETENQEQSTDL